MSNSNFLWEIILREIKNEVTPQVFETWFSRASIDNVDFVKKRVVITSKELLVSQYIQGTYDAKLINLLGLSIFIKNKLLLLMIINSLFLIKILRTVRKILH